MQLIDLGAAHMMSWFVAYGQPDQRVGAIVWHPLTPQCSQACIDLGQCGGAVLFDVSANVDTTRPRWQVESWDPLTLSPSLLCHCGDHGFIVEGRWVA
jgi:hypothetical protein